MPNMAVVNFKVAGLNNAKGLEGLDGSVASQLLASEGADRDHGICSGISLSWIVAFLNKNDRAIGAKGAKDFDEFFNVLRFQGSYMKALGREASIEAIEKLPTVHGGKFDYGIKKDIEEEHFGMDVNWVQDFGAYYVSLFRDNRRHAIAFGRWDDKYYLMEPNYGLLGFDEYWKFTKDFSRLVTHYQQSYLPDQQYPYFTVLKFVPA